MEKYCLNLKIEKVKLKNRKGKGEIPLLSDRYGTA
jgi:hypothetical protein